METTNFTERFLQACTIGDIQYVSSILREHPDLIQVIDTNGHSPIHIACIQNHPDLASLILRISPSSVEKPIPSSGLTPLHLAIQHACCGKEDDCPRSKLLEVLISHSANIHATDSSKRRPLHYAALNGCISSARKLLHNGALIDVADEKASTPLCIAIKNTDKEMVQFLIEHKADLHSKGDSDCRFPLHIAIVSNQLDIVKTMVEKDSTIIHRQDGNGRDAIFIALGFGQTQIAEYLLGHPSNESRDRNTFRDFNYCTPLSLLCQMAARDEKKYHHAITWYINRFSSQISAEIVDLDSLGLTSLHHAPSTRILSVLLPHCDNINVGQNSLNGTPLHYYASKGSLELVDFILSKGADLNALDVCSNTALHLAAENGHLSIVKVLVEKGLSVMARNEEGCIPLHLACENGWNDCVRYLISKGSDPNMKSNNGIGCLTVAAQNGHIEVVKVLVQSGIDINTTDPEGDTALHVACAFNKLAIVEYLVASGASVNVKNKNEDTPLHDACRLNSIEVASYLVEHGANIFSPDCDGDTPLGWSSFFGNEDLASFLASKGGIELINSQCGNMDTPLHWACKKGYDQIVEFLLEKGASPNLKNANLQTPLHWACSSSGHTYYQCANVLILFGAEVNAVDKDANTPLHFACKTSNAELVQWLLEENAAVNSRNKYGETPLDVARKHRQKDIINYLTEYISSLEEEIASNQDEIVLALPLYNRLHSAIKDCSNSLLPNLIQKYPDDVNHAVNEGLTPLHLACMTGNFEAVKLLHEAGANPTVKDKKYGNAAIHWAVNGSHANIVQYLIRSADVDINVINLKQNTPLMIAMENGDEAITWLLLTYGADLSAKNEDGKTVTDKAGKNIKVLNLVWLWTGVSTVVQQGEFLEIEKGEWIRQQVSTWGADSKRISQHWKSKRLMKSRSTESNNPTEIARVTYEKVRALLKSYEQKGYIDKVNVLHYINMFFDDTEAIIRQWSDCQKQYKTLSGKVEKFLPSAPGTKVAPDEKVKDLEEDIRDFQNNIVTNFRQKLAPEFPTDEYIITFKGEMEVLRSYSSCLESTIRSLEKAKESLTQNQRILLEQPFTSVILAPYMDIFLDFTEPHRKEEPESMLGILNTIFDQEKLDSSSNGGQTTRRTMLGRGMGLVGSSAPEGDSDESTNSLPIHQLQDTEDTQHDAWEDVSTEDSSAGSSFIKSGKIIPTLPIPSSLGVKESIQYKPLLEFIHKHLVTYIDHLINRYNGLSIIIKKNLTIIEQIEEARSSIVQQVLSDLVQFENSLAEGLGKAEAGGVHSKGGLFGFVTKFKFGEKPDKDSRQSKKSRMSGI